MSNKAVALAILKQFKKAIKCFDGALHLDPDRHVVWHNKASTLQELGKNDKAAKFYQESQRLISGVLK